jgi:hypothetical protein
MFSQSGVGGSKSVVDLAPALRLWKSVGARVPTWTHEPELRMDVAVSVELN